MKNILLVFSALLILSFASCENNNGPEGETGPYLNLSTYIVKLPTVGGEEVISVETNLPKIVAASSETDWCPAELVGNKITITVGANTGLGQRQATITVKGEGSTQTINVTQSGIPVASIVDDVKIPVASGTAEYHYSTNPIEKSFDGDYESYFMSAWTGTVFPFDVVYNFENVPTMDYFIYYPRGAKSGTGTNGLLGRIEVWYTTAGQTEFSHYGDYDFQRSTAAQRIDFYPALTNPTQIKLVLYEGQGTGGNYTYAAIGEMEFYRKSDDAFDPTTIFTDHSASELKPGITRAQIDAIDNEFFKYLATAIYNEEYDLESRVGEYKAWQNPGIMAAINKTSKYSQLDNPTGMYVEEDEELIVLASDFGRVNVSLQVIDLSTGGAGTKSNYALTKGINKFTTTSKGLVYVMYHTDAGTEPPVKINFVTGQVNGYFEKGRNTDNDWAELLDNAVGPHFDVVGQYAHLTFPVSDLKRYTPTNVTALIQKFDDLVYMEMEFLGLVKYDSPTTPRLFRNRMYFHCDESPNSLYMYAIDYRTGYSMGTMNVLCGFGAANVNVWGPAHEVGHMNQTRPGLKWQGLSEVTNNITSLHVQTSFGATSRLLADNNYGKFVTNAGAGTIIGGGLAYAEGNIWEQLIQFWQLKLYLVDALGKADFYKDLYEHFRITPNLDASQLTDGVYQLDFVRQVCRIANLDLTAFFETWGLLKPVDLNTSAYNTSNFIITQSQVDALKAEIATANYPQPAHNDIHLITDLNVDNYR